MIFTITNYAQARCSDFRVRTRVLHTGQMGISERACSGGAPPGHTQHTAQPAQPSHHYQRTITAASPTSHTTTTVRTLVFTTVLVHSAEKMRLPEGARGERSPYHLSVCAGACPPECLLSGDSQRVRWCSLKSGASASNCTAVASLWVNSR